MVNKWVQVIWVGRSGEERGQDGSLSCREDADRGVNYLYYVVVSLKTMNCKGIKISYLFDCFNDDVGIPRSQNQLFIISSCDLNHFVNFILVFQSYLEFKFNTI